VKKLRILKNIAFLILRLSDNPSALLEFRYCRDVHVMTVFLSSAKGLQKLNGDCAGVIPDFHVCLLFAAPAVVYGVRKILSV